MRTLLCSLLVCGIVAAPAGASVTASSLKVPLGQTVAVSGEVGNVGNDLPALYVDWKARACPGSRAAAKAAVTDKTRIFGMPAGTPGSDDTDTYHFTEKVLVEQPRQRICAYGAGGALEGSALVVGRVKLRGDLLISDTVERRYMSTSMLIRGTGGYGSNFACQHKRFWIPSGLTRAADGSVSFKRTVKADNSDNYDRPLPPKYFGHATLTVRSRTVVGDSFDPDGEQWGVMYLDAKVTFRAPGLKPGIAGKPGCLQRTIRMVGPGKDSSALKLMRDQGTTAGFSSPGESTVANHPPFAHWEASPGSGQIGDESATVHFTDTSVDDDGTIVKWSWSFGDGATSTERNPVHTYTTGGTYDVTITVTDDKGAVRDYTNQVTMVG